MILRGRDRVRCITAVFAYRALAGRGRASGPSRSWAAAIIWIYGRDRRAEEPSSSFASRCSRFEALTQFRRRSRARAKNPERSRRCPWRQPDRGRAGRRAGRQSRPANHRRRDGLVVTGICARRRAATRVSIVRIEDAAQPVPRCGRPSSSATAGETSGLPLEVAARVADVVERGWLCAQRRTRRWPTIAALSALLQAADMIRDPRDGAWAPIARARAGPCRAPPRICIRTFGSGRPPTAEAAQASTFPIAPRTMSEAASAWKQRLTLRLDAEDAGAYVDPVRARVRTAALRLPRAPKRFCCAAIRSRKAPKGAAWRIVFL